MIYDNNGFICVTFNNCFKGLIIKSIVLFFLLFYNYLLIFSCTQVYAKISGTMEDDHWRKGNAHLQYFHVFINHIPCKIQIKMCVLKLISNLTAVRDLVEMKGVCSLRLQNKMQLFYPSILGFWLWRQHDLSLSVKFTFWFYSSKIHFLTTPDYAYTKCTRQMTKWLLILLLKLSVIKICLQHLIYCLTEPSFCSEAMVLNAL